MKVKIIIFSILTLLFGRIETFAQSANQLSIPVIDGKLGNEISVPVYLTNDNEIAGIQVNIRFPQGAQVNINSVSLSERKDNHTITARSMGNGDYLFVIFSADNKLIKGNSGALFTVPVKIPMTWEENSTHPITFNQVIISSAQGDNLATGSEPGAIRVIAESRPDFTVENIQINKNSLNPGDKLIASWTVKNIGDAATASGWSEQVLFEDDNSKQTVLGSLYQDGIISAGNSVNRQAELTLSQLPGIEGNVKLSVRIIPNADSGELPGAQGNNTAKSAQYVTITKKLLLTTPQYAIPENSTASIQCKVSRSGNWSEQQTFTLTTDNPQRISVPASVTIPAQQSGAFFYIKTIDNNVLDIDSTVTITVSGNGYESVSETIVIEDDELASLSLSSSKTELTEGETFVLTVERERTSTSELLVYLTCNYPKRFEFPAQITIPAGQKSASVTITAIDDNIPDMTRNVEFTASAAKHKNEKLTLVLYDNDMPEMTLTLAPQTVSEAAGPSAVKAVLRRLTKKDGNLTVVLSDNSNGSLYYPSSKLTLAPGVEEVQFTIGVIDNAIVEGDRTVDITASVYLSSCNCSVSGTNAGVVSAQLTILDDDGPALKITSSQAMLQEGKTDAAILTVTRNTPATESLTVTISSDHDSELTYDKTVVIPAGSASVQVPVTVLANDIIEGDRTVVFTVTAGGFTKGTCWVMITDQTLPDALISLISLSDTKLQAGGQTSIKIVVVNAGAAALPAQVPVNVYLSNSSNALATFYTQKALAINDSDTIIQRITMPDATGSYTVHAVVNEKQSIKELLYLNNTSEKIPVRLTPKFTATATTDKTVYKQGEAVIITGQLSGNGIANAAMEVYIINSGVRQTLDATTDDAGHYQITFQPSVYQSGHFTIGACYPKEGLTAEQASIDIYGAKREGSGYITHDLTVNEPYRGAIRLTNTGTLPLSNVKTEMLTTLENGTLVFEPVSVIAGNATVALNYTLTGNAPSEGDDWQEIKVRISSNESELMDLTIRAYFRSARGKLEANISSIKTTMAKGTSRDYPIVITNKGKGETGKISISLPSGAKWLSTATPREMASLASNESATAILRFTPGDDLQLNVPITGTIGVNCENGTGFPLSFAVEPVSESTGTLVVDVCDEYTYYTAEAPHLAGAKVVLKHPVTGAVIAEGTTNTAGLFTVNNLPEGYYTIDVSADKHDRYQNNILVDPGRETRKVVNLSFQAITIEWNVVETEVEDKYDITTTVKYETNVPVPVVLIETPEQLPIDELLNKGFYIFNAVITNKGLITAEDVQLTFPNDPDLSFEYPAMDNLSLRPQESIVVPIKVSLNMSSKSPSLRSSETLICKKFIISGIYVYYCGLDKKWHRLLSLSINIGTECSEPVQIDDRESGGLIGPSVLGGGSYYSANSTERTIQSNPECNNPCAVTIPKAVAGCLPNAGCFISGGIDLVYAYYSNQAIDFRAAVISIITCVTKDAFEALAGSKIPNCIRGIISAIMSCTKIEIESSSASTRSSMLAKKANSLDAMLDNMEQIEQYIELINTSFFSIFPKEQWGKVENLREFVILFFDNTDSSGLIDAKGLMNVKNNFFNPFISGEDIQSFAERWNRSVSYWNDGYYNVDDLPTEYNTNFITFNSLKVGELNQINEHSIESGYNDLNDMFESTLTYLENYGQGSGSVCSSISLQFSQTMTMTRQAFRGTLTVFNGHESVAMQNVKLNLVVKDEFGRIATSHEFQINNESLKDFGGDLNGYWSLDAQKTGTATIVFIPTKYAALTEPVNYSFGGTLSYIDPFTGLEVTRDLFPVTLTVKPSPNLDLTYFMQRDILGDDPLTPEIESIVPAEFSLLINNVGAGDATNIRMVTQQPKIVDNQKGLFINFELLSSQLNGGEHTLALGGSVPTEFGNIPAGKTAYAQWWFTGSLLGHFTEYDVKATHVTSYGNPDLTLLNDVSIHELIRSIHTRGLDNSLLTGFMVNDIPDAEDLPDRLYLSDGTIEPVAHTTNITCTSMGNNQYRLTVTPTANGWNYGAINDPTNGYQQLVEIKRVSDGAIIDLRNCWQTDRTLRDGKDPLYENKLHLADKLGNGSEQYLLTFSPRPNTYLEVEAFEGVPESVSSTAIQEITVRFNKNIIAATFTSDDLRLICQGDDIDVSLISITPVDERTFRLGLSAVTQTDGYYVLTVQTSGITDVDDYQGKTGKSADWNQYLGGKMQFNLKIEPEAGGTVTPLAGKYDYNSALNLQAVPNEGYTFEKWSINGETLSTEAAYNFILLSSRTLTATFKLKLYDVVVDYDKNAGNITGGGSGKLEHGSHLILRAEPQKDYLFSGWTVNGEDKPGTALDIIVNSNINIQALFVRKNIPVADTTHISRDICQGGVYNFFGTNLTATGTYKHTLQNVQGGDSIIQLALTVHPYPATPTISVTGTHTLISSSATGNQWYDEDGRIDGANTQSFTPGENGIYYVTVSNGFCESTPSDKYKVDISSQTLLSWDWEVGWHWPSINTAEPVNPKIFFNPVKESFTRLLSQTEELIYDSQYGFIGNINEFDPRAGYKLEMKGNIAKELFGTVASPENYIIPLRKGWNWIGYPVLLNLELSVALSKLQAETNDVIKNQTDFATFDGTNWVGTLTKLTPGEGYIFYSASNKPLEYSSIRVVKEPSGKRIISAGQELLWEFNPHKYPNNMNMVSRLYLDGEITPENAYTVGAFCGEECRGIGKYVNGYLFITISGTNKGEHIRFKAMENQSQKEVQVKEAVAFDEVILGTLNQPYSLNISNFTGIDAASKDDFGMYPNPAYSRINIKGDISKIKMLQITNITGEIIMRMTDLKNSSIDVSTLSLGTYLLSLYTETEILNYKFIKASK